MEKQDLLNIGRQLLEMQAFSKLIGAELTKFTSGEAVLEIPVKENLLQQNGFVHGGILSYAADNALTFVGGSVLGQHVLTSEYKINYLRPAIGEKLIAIGTVIYAGKRQAVCRCDVQVLQNGEKKICATAQGTIVTIDPM
ncbi:PaaI family thioesterase [Virgibacillus proomii]|uniref:PaaI family thioesterase n=1 Tax=Virgibacillus proomii TaxID=84407 RepID=UPI0009842A7C|nr:PaaI family thioesterase [Virgibacillus proomii]